MEWFLFGTGVCGVNHFEAGSFVRSKKSVKYPDVQHHFFPGAVEQQKDVVKVHAYQIHCGTMRPKSRGYVKIRSSNPRDKPIIQPNVLSVQEDLDELCDSIKLTIEILNAKAFDKFRRRNINFDNKMAFDNKLLIEWVKNHVESAYHCSCTCAMGLVTESDGRVMGVNNLRVCDASIMPSVTTGNTNAPTIMIAERVADLIKGESLPPAEAKFYVAPS
jgi:choline dehydrogenase